VLLSRGLSKSRRISGLSKATFLLHPFDVHGF
jgi:hypothetical protein